MISLAGNDGALIFSIISGPPISCQNWANTTNQANASGKKMLVTVDK